MVEDIQGASEKIIAPEIPRDGWETLLILHRHSAYDARRPVDPDNPTEDEQKSLGRLTEDGIRMAAERADERLDVVLRDEPENVYFLIVNSPTYWLDDQRLGRRAQETADIIVQRLLRRLEDLGVSPDHLLNTVTSYRGAKGSITKLNTNVQESQMFQFPDYVGPLREKYKGQGPDFWIARNRDTDAELRRKVGAPGPADDARDINLAISAEAKYARSWHQRPENEGRRLVIWTVTHGDGLSPYVQRVINAPEEAFFSGYNDGVAIAIDEKGNGTAIVSGETYKVPLVAHGDELIPSRE